MKSKVNVLLYPLWYEEEWNQGRTFQKVAEHLAKRDDIRRVIVVFPQRKPLQRYTSPIKTVTANSKLTLLTTYTQCVPTDCAPFRLRKWANRQIDGISRLYLRLAGFRADNTVLWFFPPLTETSQTHINYPARMTVTQIVDNFLTGDQNSPLHKAAREQYALFGNNSDLIITGSKPMYEFFCELNDNTCLMENATDEAFIASYTEMPHRLNSTPPRLGYIGFISSRTDLELLNHVALSRPNYQLVIAGPLHDVTETEFKTLTTLANVDYLGSVPYSDLPGLISSFDVCLIPHRDTPLSRSMSPLKFFQYLGSGRPIVSTQIGGLDRFQHHISSARNPQEFIQMIDTSLNSTTIKKAQAQIEAAKLETWDSRINMVFRRVQDHLDRTL